MATRSGRVRAAVASVVAALAAVSVLAGCAQSSPGATPPVRAPQAAGELSRADVDAWLDGVVPAALDRSGIPGAAVSIVHDGELLTARGYGRADVELGTPVDPEETLFRTGSVSKLFTATAVMQLVERGELDLDVNVEEYLDLELDNTFDAPVTLRTLLSHTAGFEERYRDIISLGEEPMPLRDFVLQVPAIVAEPGTVPAYSNYGLSLAGYIVERVSGTPFDEYIRSSVLEPLGMGSSSFTQPLPADLEERLASGYSDASAPAGPFEGVDPAPAGALTSSATDMARFMLSQLGEGEASVLEPATLDLMQRPALDDETLGTLAEGPRMTLGYFDESRGGTRVLGHGGDTLYFHSHLQLFPDDGAGIFISMNGSGRGPLDSTELREAVLEGFADRYFAGEPSGGASRAASDRQVEPTAAEHAALAEGTYRESRSGSSNFMSVLAPLSPVTVQALDDGRIVVTPGPVSLYPAVFEEVAPWRWQEVDGERVLSMRVEDGVVQAIGYESAFAYLRTGEKESAALPVLVTSAAVLLIALLAWPIGAIVRRRSGSRGIRSVPLLLTRLGVAATVLALAAWTATILAVAGLEQVPDASIRVTQGLQLLGVAAIVPGVLTFVQAIRRRWGWRRVIASGLVVLALVGVAWFAFAFHLLSPSIAY